MITSPQPSIKELKGKHTGAPVAILGAGGGLQKDLSQIPAESILIGVNWHASKLAKLDYMTFLDSPKYKPYMIPIVDAHGGHRLSPVSDYTDWVMDVPYWGCGYTFIFAIWCGLYFGGDPVLLCGFDLFSKGGHFFDDGQPNRYQFRRQMAAALKCRENPGDHNRVKALSGPLVNVWGRYEIKNPFREFQKPIADYLENKNPLSDLKNPLRKIEISGTGCRSYSSSLYSWPWLCLMH